MVFCPGSVLILQGVTPAPLACQITPRGPVIGPPEKVKWMAQVLAIGEMGAPLKMACLAPLANSNYFDIAFQLLHGEGEESIR